MVNTSNLEEFKAKFEEVCKDEEFVKSLLALDEPADVKAALEGKGIEMTEEEIIQVKDLLVKTAEKGGEELEITAEMVNEKLEKFTQSSDLSKFIL